MLGLYLGSSWLLKGHPSCGKGGYIPLFICLLCSGYIRYYSMSQNSPIFHTASLLWIFLSTESSCWWVNCPSFVSSWLLIIFEIGSSVFFGGFPSQFFKCCFHRCIRSSWLAAFSLALAVIFLRLKPFTVCHTILDCIASTMSLILLIRFCMHSVYSFWCTWVHFVL